MPRRLIDVNAPTRWVHRSDRLPDGKAFEGATVYEIVALSEGESRKLSLEADTDTADGIKSTSQARVIAACVKRIHRVLWPGAAEAVTIETPQEIDRFVCMLPATDAAELSLACINWMLLDEGAIKN